MFSQSFFSHLNELRDRVIMSLAVFFVCTMGVWNFLDPVIRYVVRPIGRVVFTSPEGAFSARMTLAMTGGFLLALPVIVYHCWKFIALGLTQKERGYIKVFGPLSLLLFFCGSIFGFWVMLPYSMNFLMSFSSAWMVPMITVDKYISFVGTIVLASGVAFELPLILAFLAKIGIATPEFLRQKRSFAVILILITSAIITPPDVVSQVILTLPLMILYETGILFAQWTKPQKHP